MEIKPINVKEIWRLGFRIYYGDEFIVTTPFEEDAYSFISKYQNDPALDIPIHSYLKRINYIYKQKYNELINLKNELELTKEFRNIEIIDSPSVIGLPKFIAYTHIVTNIRTEFDGLIFISEQNISNDSYSVEKAIEFIKKESETSYLLNNVQTGSPSTSVSKKFSEKISAFCEWIFTSNSVDFCDNKFQLSGGFQIQHLIFSISLIDQNLVTLTMPVQTYSQGETYYFLIGDKSHLRQVVAHDWETLRYLNYLEERLKSIRDDVLMIQNSLFHEVPLLKWTLNPFVWGKAIGYATSLQRSLERIVKYKLYLPIFKAIIQAYSDFEKSENGFYNLPSIYCNQEGISTHQDQFSTPSPFRLEITESKLIVTGNDKLFRVFKNKPENLNKFYLAIHNLTDQSFELLQSLTVTPALHTGMMSTLVALIAMFISILVSALPFTLEKISVLFQLKNVPVTQKSIESSDLNQKIKVIPLPLKIVRPQ